MVEEKKHAARKYRGASRIHEFATCGHVGHGKFCHTCVQLETGEFIKKDNGNIVPNPNHITHRLMAQYVKNQMPDENFEGMSKTAVVDHYLRLKKVTISKLKERMGDQGIERLKKHFKGR